MADQFWNRGFMKPASFVAVLVFLVPCFLGAVRAQTHDKKRAPADRDCPVRRFCRPQENASPRRLQLTWSG
jgi:hypothetical protein